MTRRRLLMASLCIATSLFSSTVAHAAENDNHLETESVIDFEEESEVEAESSERFREPIRQDALTKEQEEEGWMIIGGYAYPPEALAGQIGMYTESIESAAKDKKTSNVTFAADVPVNQTEPFIIYFTNADTYTEYFVELYASNNYEATVKVPIGAYYFTGGGPENDYMSLYDVIKPASFQVEPGAGLLVKPVIRSKSDHIEKEAKEVPENETETETPTEDVEVVTTTEETDDSLWYVYLIWAFVSFGIGVILGATAFVVSRHDD